MSSFFFVRAALSLIIGNSYGVGQKENAKPVLWTMYGKILNKIYEQHYKRLQCISFQKKTCP